MKQPVFISYSRSDRFFGELLELRLSEANIDVWRDASSLVPGDEWRSSIDIGISDSKIVILVLSQASCESRYVTYEWSYAMGQQKTIVPVLLERCDMHPKIAPIQYIDFQSSNEATWQKLVDRIQHALEDTSERQGVDVSVVSNTEKLTRPEKRLEAKIVAYLQGRGFRLMGFDRIQERIAPNATEADLKKLVAKSSVFRSARLKNNRKGLALL